MTTYRVLVYLLIGLLGIFGCASTQEYSKFAQAGTLYHASIDRLLTASAKIQIDRTSENILQDYDLTSFSPESYQKYSQVDKDRLEILNKLQDHSRIMARYFEILNQLATSQAPQRAQKAVDGVYKNILELGTKLRETPLGKTGDYGQLTEIAVSYLVRGLLHEELITRKDKIWLELKTQEELLRLLATEMSYDLQNTQSLREYRLVIIPLIGHAITDKNKWVDNRREILTMPLRVEELKAATDTARQLREAFEDLVAGRNILSRLDSLLADLEAMLAVADTFKNK